MQLRNGTILFSPSDLITFMESPFASHMERWRLHDPGISDLMDPKDKMLSLLQDKGYQHEDDFLETLKKQQKSVILIERAPTDVMQTKTREALNSGADVIAQAYLEFENFGGFADFLIKVPGKSNLGDYHYEVWDTKLSKKMKPYFAIQLCCYAEMLEREQGVRPRNVAIVLGSQEIVTLRVEDYAAYYASLKSAFLTFQGEWTSEREPDPAERSSFGRWSNYANDLLVKRRHLSLIANISRSQIKRLENAGISTIDKLATTRLDSVSKISRDIFERLKAQAAIQVSSEDQARPEFSILPHNGERLVGLSLLPPASKNDVFFDIEGFPLVDGGLEYLWGATYFEADGSRSFRDFWAHDREEERKAFTEFVDWIYDRWRDDPTLHVYHYASYEVSALRRLMGRYGLREHEVDTLLRTGIFVDLYAVVRHGVLVGEPRYSIKNIEHLYRGTRDTDVVGGGESVVVYEEWRNSPDGETWETSKALKAIRDYNIDDCNSTQELAAWLREQQSANGISYDAPSSESETPEQEEETEVTRLRDELLDLAENEADDTKKLLIRNLAWLLEFHKRENKPTWWNLFDRLDKTEMDLHDEMNCLVGLQRTKRESYLPTPRSKNRVYQYSFDPDQPFKGQAKSFYILGGENEKVTARNLDFDAGLIELQAKDEPNNRISLIPDEFIRPDPIPDAIFDVVQQIIETDFASSAIVDFLRRDKPRFDQGPRAPIVPANLSGDEFLREVVQASNGLNESFLCIQGPPGAGKTYTAKHIISDLLAKGKRIGISSNSHKAITNLMEGVAVQLIKDGLDARLRKVGGEKDDPIFENPNVEFRSNPQACANELNLPGLCVGGTAWLFCNSLFTEDEGTEKLDYLFVDEAGQVSIANLVGMSRSAKNIILMGDQMQLSQPSQGSHPDESGQSILEYLLQDHATISDDLGIFLPLTYRMHPDVCRLISDQVYDGRLEAAGVTNRHIIDLPTDVFPKQCGVHFIPVEHQGNTQGSEEEVKAIVDLSQSLIGQRYWPKEETVEERRIDWSDILVVAPFNHQVNLLKAALPLEARIGSVDRFQGQEAPIVIVSMCASDASESPRGIEFLFSKNRLNVAISRAQALAIVIGSPNLATTPVGSLHQMELVNFYAEIVQCGR